MHSEVGSVHRVERIAEVDQAGLLPRTQLPLRRDDTIGAPVIHHGEAVDPRLILTHTGRWFLGDFHFGDQVAAGRVPAGEVDTRSLSDQAAAAISTDEIRRSDLLAISEVDIDTGFVLDESDHLTAAMNGHSELVDPALEDRLHTALP